MKKQANGNLTDRQVETNKPTRRHQDQLSGIMTVSAYHFTQKKNNNNNCCQSGLLNICVCDSSEMLRVPLDTGVPPSNPIAEPRRLHCFCFKNDRLSRRTESCPFTSKERAIGKQNCESGSEAGNGFMELFKY